MYKCINVYVMYVCMCLYIYIYIYTPICETEGLAGSIWLVDLVVQLYAFFRREQDYF